MRTTSEVIVAYASRTGTKRNLDALRDHGWRLLVSAAGVHRTEGFPYALDNGAWTAFMQKKPIDLDLFVEVLTKLGADADWVALPDVVMGGQASFDLSLEWLPRVLAASPRALLPVQPGFTIEQVGDVLGPDVGVFVGGDTKWKLDTMATWSELAASKGAWCHVGRVNTARRIHACVDVGVDSFDGSGPSRFAVETPKLDRARRQGSLFGKGRFL